jgi:hypothetical protein
MLGYSLGRYLRVETSPLMTLNHFEGGKGYMHFEGLRPESRATGKRCLNSARPNYIACSFPRHLM